MIWLTRSGRVAAKVQATPPPSECPANAKRSSFSASTSASMKSTYASTVYSWRGQAPVRPCPGKSTEISRAFEPSSRTQSSHMCNEPPAPWISTSGMQAGLPWSRTWARAPATSMNFDWSLA